MTAFTSTKSPVDERISRLQAIEKIDPQAAQDAAWAWIERLGAGLPGHTAEIELAQLFAAGAPAVVDGQTEGILVGWTTPDADLNRTGRAIRAISRAMFTLFILAMEMCEGCERTWSFSRPTCSMRNWALVISVIIQTSFSCTS